MGDIVIVGAMWMTARLLLLDKDLIRGCSVEYRCDFCQGEGHPGKHARNAPVRRPRALHIHDRPLDI